MKNEEMSIGRNIEIEPIKFVMEEMFGQSHTAFFCTCDYVDFYDTIRLEDCDDQF